VFDALDQHVLQQVAEAGFDGTLVARLDLEEVGQRAHLSDAAVGVDQHHAGGVGEPGAVVVEFLERPQAGGEPGQVLLA
jgi:hypothetical protein